MILDIFILLPLFWGGYQGYSRGLLAELVAIIHFAIAFAISFRVIGILFRLINDNIFIFEENALAPIAFACAVGAAFALLFTVGKYLKTEIEYDFPGAWDNIIGAVFGVMKYAIVLSFFFWFLTGFGNINNEIRNSSRALPLVEYIAYQFLGATNADEVSNKIREAL